MLAIGAPTFPIHAVPSDSPNRRRSGLQPRSELVCRALAAAIIRCFSLGGVAETARTVVESQGCGALDLHMVDPKTCHPAACL
jgi:hypothetical protein